MGVGINFYDNQEEIAKNLLAFIRYKGYSKLSLSKLTEISRPTIDQILNASSPNQTIYNSQISKINETFSLPIDFFLRSQTIFLAPTPSVYAYSDHAVGTERSVKTQELLDALDNVLDIFSMYLK
jgi:transcriptional regulator with XRE-family HTH domain